MLSWYSYRWARFARARHPANPYDRLRYRKGGAKESGWSQEVGESIRRNNAGDSAGGTATRHLLGESAASSPVVFASLPLPLPRPSPGAISHPHLANYLRSNKGDRCFNVSCGQPYRRRVFFERRRGAGWAGGEGLKVAGRGMEGARGGGWSRDGGHAAS
jgi:hypothetical protein